MRLNSCLEYWFEMVPTTEIQTWVKISLCLETLGSASFAKPTQNQLSRLQIPCGSFTCSSHKPARIGFTTQGLKANFNLPANFFGV